MFTVEGRYRARGWTEWTQGFQFGSALLQFDATGDTAYLELGRSRTVERMAPHLTAAGVHDHGFNNVSTYGNLWRLAREGRYDAAEWERRFYELALKVSGAVQARRWTPLPDGGFIHSFNGAHSLFVDTMRSLRSLAIAYRLGQPLMEEQDAAINLLGASGAARARHRALQRVLRPRPRSIRRPRAASRTKACSTPPTAPIEDRARSRAIRRSLPGRAGSHGRCSGSWSSSNSSRRFPTRRWRRAAAGRRSSACSSRRRARPATTTSTSPPPTACRTGTRGARSRRIWADGAIVRRIRSTIASRSTARRRQSRRRRCSVWAARLSARGEDGARYSQAGLRVLETLLDEPYLSVEARHQGLLLHSVYHWPNGWDHVPAGARTPRGESSQWGDYHLREAALLVKRLAEDRRT